MSNVKTACDRRFQSWCYSRQVKSWFGFTGLQLGFLEYEFGACNKVSSPTRIFHSPTVGMTPMLRFAPSVSYQRLHTRCPCYGAIIFVICTFCRTGMKWLYVSCAQIVGCPETYAPPCWDARCVVSGRTVCQLVEFDPVGYRGSMRMMSSG